MVIDISGEISQEAFGNLIRAYDSLQNDDILRIYINSTGGDPSFADAILDFIENNKVVEIIAYGKIYSAAFDIFYKAKCPKRIVNGIMGMAHLSRIEMANFTVTDNEEISQASNYKNWWNQDKLNRLKFYEEIGMTKKELSKIKKGEDVYFQHERLLELLNGKS